ncbi:MAG TPA: transposase, partial [Terriglobales bacterium]|nr:transposase [Terriglobales bacterium]
MGHVKRHTSEQIVNIMRQIEVAVAKVKTTPAVSRQVGITEQTYYHWRKQYGGLKLVRAGLLAVVVGVCLRAEAAPVRL